MAKHFKNGATLVQRLPGLSRYKNRNLACWKGSLRLKFLKFLFVSNADILIKYFGMGQKHPNRFCFEVNVEIDKFAAILRRLLTYFNATLFQHNWLHFRDSF